jgi:hypothetical protein
LGGCVRGNPLRRLRARSARGCLSPGTSVLSWSYRPLQSLGSDGRSALSVQRLPYTVCSVWEPGPGAFHPPPWPADFRRLAHPLVRFESPSEFDRPILPPHPPVGRFRGAFHGVCCPYGVVSLRSPLTPGLPHPVRSAFRLSQPLRGLLLREPCGSISPR